MNEDEDLALCQLMDAAEKLDDAVLALRAKQRIADELHATLICNYVDRATHWINFPEGRKLKPLQLLVEVLNAYAEKINAQLDRIAHLENELGDLIEKGPSR